jgi:two-component system chemotaxis response regulator CheY
VENTSKRVVIADDEPHIRALLRTILTALGAIVVAEAPDGEQAVQAFDRHRPNLVMLDMNMPKVDGLAALKRIRTIDPDAAVVMLTSVNQVAIVEACLEAGALNYLLKDTTAEALTAALAQTWADLLADRTTELGEA